MMPPKKKQMTRQSTFLARGPKRKLQRETCIHRQGTYDNAKKRRTDTIVDDGKITEGNGCMQF